MEMQNDNMELIPVISVILITETSDAGSVENAINSVLSQTGNFSVQITIVLKEHDSRVADLCQTYKALYPEKIRFYTRLTADVTDNISIYGDYILLCRDYEILSDSKKLGIQCNFLSTHPEYTICFHNVSGSGYPILSEGDYNTKCLSLSQVIKYYSPLIRVKANPVKFNFMLYEKDGGMLFVRDSYRGLMRCISGISSSITPTKKRAPLLKNISEYLTISKRF